MKGIITLYTKDAIGDTIIVHVYSETQLYLLRTSIEHVLHKKQYVYIQVQHHVGLVGVEVLLLPCTLLL